MTRLLIAYVVSILIVSCQKEPEIPVSKPIAFDQKTYVDSLKTERANQKKKKTQPSITQKNSVKSSENKASDNAISSTDTIKLTITYGKAKMDTLKKPGQRIVFEFNSDTAKKLNLKLSSKDSTSNLRITQIYNPEGVSDGPFGKELLYPIDKKGIYRVVVSENKMGGDPWGGRFQFEVKLGW